MSHELTFYTHPMSRGRIVRWMLEETGQPYDTQLLDYGTTMKDAAYLAVNPMGKVPALRHGDTVITEGAAICAYLADAFPQAKLAPPPGNRARGPYFRWMFYAAGPLEAAVFNKSMGFVVPQDKAGVAGYGRFADVMDTLEAALAHDHYICGADFSAADVVLGSQIGWGMMFGMVDKRAVFEAYWARIGQRPAALRARAIDDALLARPA